MSFTFKPQGVVTQKYLENANELYKSQGLAGHTGVDWINDFGKPIRAEGEGFVYKIFSLGDLESNWCAVYILYPMKGDDYLEVCYGHISKCYVKLGDWVSPGQHIADEGNYGDVFYGGKRITADMQRAGDIRGSHCHESTRPVRRRQFIEKGNYYLEKPGGAKFFSGGYFEIINNNPHTRGHMDPFLYSEANGEEKKIAILKSVLSPIWALLGKLKK